MVTHAECRNIFPEVIFQVHVLLRQHPDTEQDAQPSRKSPAGTRRCDVVDTVAFAETTNSVSSEMAQKKDTVSVSQTRVVFIAAHGDKVQRSCS